MKLSNNATRIIVSIIAIPGILAVAYFGGIYFFLFALFISLISFVEFSLMVNKKGVKPNVLLGLTAVMIIFLNQYYFLLDYYILFIVFMIIVLIIELFRNNGSPIMNLGATLLGVMYIGLFGTTMVSLREIYPDIGELYVRGGYIIITILASIWICDSAAYFGGKAIGKHKLFKRVSPNKSWEGAVFGFIFSIISVIVAKYLVLDFLSWTAILVIGLIVGIIGQAGDLVESLIKRDAEVKDSSSLIPGHGGIFDRFDSLLMTAPVVYVLLRFMK